jgi:hypothetical protein
VHVGRLSLPGELSLPRHFLYRMSEHHHHSRPIATVNCRADIGRFCFGTDHDVVNYDPRSVGNGTEPRPLDGAGHGAERRMWG